MDSFTTQAIVLSVNTKQRAVNKKRTESKCILVEVDPYHIIHVKDDGFISHGFNLSWKGKP